MEQLKTQLLYAPEWQYNSLLAWANELYVVAPRGTGKTERIQAIRALDCVKAMPRAKGAMLAVSYKKLYTHLIPPLISSWEMLGYRRGIDFWIGNEKRPNGWVIDNPYITPVDRQDFIQFSNGHGIHMISQDRPGMSNGLTVQWMGADETRLMNKQRYDEDASAIIRGLAPLFEHLPQYCAITMTTDMPVSEDGQWILDMENQMDPDRIDLILEMSIELENLRAEDDLNSTARTRADIKELQAMVNDLRREAVHFVEVSDGSNLLFLGKKFIITQMRTMERTLFNASILGLRPITLAGKFYPAFNVNKHGYHKSNHEYIAKTFSEGGINDCRTDDDLSTSTEIHCATDHNAAIHCIGFAQMEGLMHKLLSSFYVLGREGKKLNHLLKEVIEYYYFHPTKDLVYHYDHTMISTKGLDELEKCYKDTVVDAFGNAGWNIREVYHGQAPFHDIKFRTINNIHAEDGSSKFRSRINRDNNDQLIKVLQLTQGAEIGGMFQKDKKKDKQVKTFPQEFATHLSDMYDLLLLGTLKDVTTDNSWMITR